MLALETWQEERHPAREVQGNTFRFSEQNTPARGCFVSMSALTIAARFRFCYSKESIMRAKINSPHVSVILLNWNNSTETIECLYSLQGVTYPNFRVLIVDNHSTDDSLQKLEKVLQEIDEYPVAILRNSDNLGFSGGNNTGFRHALSQGTDYILALNNDTTVDPAFLDELVGEGEKYRDAGIFAPAINFYYEPDLVWFGGRTSVTWRKMDKAITSSLFSREVPDNLHSIDVNFITGCAMLLRASALKDVEGFDERFFLYFEDADLSFRFQEAGWALRWVPSAKILHKVSVTTLGQVGTPRIHYYNTRNILLLSRKHGPKWMIFYRPLWAIYTLGKQLGKIALGRNRETSRAIVRGVVDYYRGRFGKYE